MPKSSKPVACICGSRSIKSVSFNLYMNPDDYGQIITGGANGVDTLAERWAARRGIEVITYRPQYEVYGKKYAPLQRDKDMVNACDIVIAFWDGKSNGTKFTIDYAREIGVPVIVHLIEER